MSSAALGPGTLTTASKSKISETFKTNQKPAKTRNSKTFETAATFRTGTCQNPSKHGTLSEPRNLSEPIETSTFRTRAGTCQNPIEI